MGLVVTERTVFSRAAAGIAVVLIINLCCLFFVKNFFYEKVKYDNTRDKFCTHRDEEVEY